LAVLALALVVLQALQLVQGQALALLVLQLAAQLAVQVQVQVPWQVLLLALVQVLVQVLVCCSCQ
jgi:hypothetical protein